MTHSSWYLGFPISSVGKESTCNAGDLGSIPASGRSPEEEIGYPLQYSWASLVAQLVKNPPAIVGDLGLIPGLGRCPGEGKGYPCQYSALENFMDCMVQGGHKESDTTEWLNWTELMIQGVINSLTDFHGDILEFSKASLEVFYLYSNKSF